MSAGTQYSKQLNMDLNYVRTPAFYDTNNDEWLMGAAQFVKNASGLWVPVSETNPMPAKLTSSYVEIGGVSFAVSGGDTLRGKSADKPDAAAAHAVIPFCYYHAIDTGTVEVTDGMKWVVI